MRFIKVFVLVAVLAGVLASTASALAFDDADYVWPTGGVGESYFKQLLGRTDGGHCDASKCSFVKIAGEFPPGISMDSVGKVTGTPQKLGTWSFWIQLRGNYGGTPAEREFSITINRIKLQVATQSLPVVVKGAAYSQSLAANGGSGTRTWTVTDGKLPDGLSLNSGTGAITGTPTANGDFVFTVKVADASPAPDTKQLMIRVVDPLVFGPLSPRVAEVGIPFSATLTGTGGTQPYQWSLAGNLPTGLALDPASGVISGTPTAAGLARLNLTLTDANGFTKSVDVGLAVVAPVTITTKRSITLTVGQSFSLKLLRQGGARPFKWAVVSGKLPKGVGLNKRTGTLSGIPSTAGTYRFRIGVTDALGGSSTKPFVFSVRA